jgi:Ulp1 family protease
MPAFNAEKGLELQGLAQRRVFLPAFVSKYVQESGRMPRGLDVTHTKAVLLTACEIYVVFNLAPNRHWAVMRAQRQRKRLEIFDSLRLVKKCHGRNMLKAISAYVHEDMSDWQVVVHQHGVPQQTDANSCGVFTCVIAKHLVEDASLPNIAEAIPEWRCWLARALVQGAVA